MLLVAPAKWMKQMKKQNALKAKQVKINKYILRKTGLKNNDLAQIGDVEN